MRRRTTLELFDEAFARHGYKPVPLGYAPPKRKAKPRIKHAKHDGNGKAR